MTDLLHTGQSSAPSATLQRATADADQLVRKSKSDNTIRAYQADWHDFTLWCGVAGAGALPASPDTVAAYLASLLAGGYRMATLRRRTSAISQAHQLAGHESPTISHRVRATLQGAGRVAGTAQQGRAPVLTQDIARMVGALPDTLAGLRDRALLLVGFAGAFRRSELVSLAVADVAFEREGLRITIRRSKTDQTGEGRLVGIPHGQYSETDPVEALQRWLVAADIHGGPLFRSVDRHGNVSIVALSPYAVALVVKRTAAAAGLDPKRYAGHSLRAGLATSAAANGVSERAIMAQTGHRSVAMVRRYIRDGSLFRENAGGLVGL